MSLISIFLLLCVASTECLPLTNRQYFSNEEETNAFSQILYSFYSNSDEMSFPKDWPFSEEIVNWGTLFLSLIILVLVLVLGCCVCFHMCCRSQYDETLIVTPSELVAIGAKPSDLQAVNITPSVLEDSGATAQQMRELGFEDTLSVKSSEAKVELKECFNQFSINFFFL